jgi:hypothetical protein
MFSVILYMLRQTVGQRCLPLSLSIFFPLFLWRFLSSQLLCAHYTMWCCAVARSDPLRHCCHHLSAIQPSPRCLTPWLRRTRALFAVLGPPHPPRRRGRLGLDFGEIFARCNAKIQLAFGVKSLRVRSVTFRRFFFYRRYIQAATHLLFQSSLYTLPC